MRRRARVDTNQAELVELFRKLGFTVQPLHTVGGGVPDLMLGRRRVNYLVEVKDGRLPPSDRCLNARQIKWHSEWLGSAHVIDSVDAAIEWAASMKAEC